MMSQNLRFSHTEINFLPPSNFATPTLTQRLLDMDTHVLDMDTHV
jgi:hypothetical protein